MEIGKVGNEGTVLKKGRRRVCGRGGAGCEVEEIGGVGEALDELLVGGES